MAFNKVFVVLLLSSLVLTFVSAGSKPNNVIVGSRVKGDRLLKFKTIKVPSKLLGVVTAEEKFTGGRITQIKLLDQNKKGNGAKASIVQGGPGKTFVTVEFKSQRGHSVDYTFEVYGR